MNAAEAMAETRAKQAAQQPTPPPARYHTLTQMLSLAELAKLGVDGDGNCGFYAYDATVGGRGWVKHPTRGGDATADDKAVVVDLRNDVVNWQMQPGAKNIFRAAREDCKDPRQGGTDPRKCVCMAQDRCCDESTCACLVSGCRCGQRCWHSDKRLCKCVIKKQPGRDGECMCDYRDPVGIGSYKGTSLAWARGPHLRALAAVDSVEVVVISTHTLTDWVRLYPGESQNPKGARKPWRYMLSASWKNEIVPQLQRQRTGEACGEGDPLHKRLARKPHPMRVLLWDGQVHFDAVRRD
jgi:hypothetical protein